MHLAGADKHTGCGAVAGKRKGLLEPIKAGDAVFQGEGQHRQQDYAEAGAEIAPVDRCQQDRQNRVIFRKGVATLALQPLPDPAAQRWLGPKQAGTQQ